MKKILLLSFSLLLLLGHPHQKEVIHQFPKYTKSSSLKIALMMPKRIIGRYSSSTIDTILAYLATRGGDFELEIFDSKDEEEDSILQTYKEIEEGKFSFIIAIFTDIGAQELARLKLTIPTYVPTVNTNQIDFDPSNSPMLFFGGISYEDQISELLKLQNSEKIISYIDDSPIGERLGQILNDQIEISSEEVITNEMAATFAKTAKNQEALINKADIFLNTPVIKSGLLLSQIGYFKKKATSFFSTQINYSPSIIILTQKRDRKNLYIANSIGTTDQKLIEYGALLNSDLKFDWVNYSTAIGMEIFYRSLFPDTLSYFQEDFINNQIQYTTQIYSMDNKGFYPLSQEEKEKIRNQGKPITSSTEPLSQ